MAKANEPIDFVRYDVELLNWSQKLTNSILYIRLIIPRLFNIQDNTDYASKLQSF